ncbi:MAG TPA: hypothetical protein DDZ51_22725 [Planctomycetaceae bacterium]|nr:hypothetical protein [Planctomycetaceae bacterium]
MSNKWRLSLRDALLLNPLILVHGNCKDVFLLDADERTRLPEELGTTPAVTMDVILALELEACGVDAVLLYDPVNGVRILRGSMHETVNRLYTGVQASSAGDRSDQRPSLALPRAANSTPESDAWMVPLETHQKPLDFLKTVQSRLFAEQNTRVGIICQFADRYLPFSDRQDTDDRQLSMVVQKAALAAWATSADGQIGSKLLLLFDMEGQIPQELNTLFPFARSVLIPPPDLQDREHFFGDFFSVFDSGSEPPVDLKNDTEQCKLAAQLSDGLRMQDLFSLATLSRREGLGLGPKQLPQLLSRFKFGTRENAWANVSTAVLVGAEERLSVRVKGQSEVISEVVPVLIRAKLGMTDIASKANSSKPRGVFFFVGPTGVGKTELSKAIAELVFGTDTALLRFDMSEYSEEHQQARFIGAPPGYIGFDQGGQLTNAINEKPFSVLLFDEIEKAHGRILDKFLQILDDGRLTDGMGKTVYFTESIIIFTSNLGTRQTNSRRAQGGEAFVPTPEMSLNSGTAETYEHLRQLPYPELCERFRRDVKDYFVDVLGRPEILNRIGEDNILVFRFLTDESAKNEIIEQLIQNMQANLLEQHRVSIRCTPSFKRLLMVHPNGFDRNGARGVRNLLNRLVLNRLAPDLLVRGDQHRGQSLRIDYEVADEQIKDTPFDQNLLAYEWLQN